MADRMVIGIIGCGVISRVYIRDIKRLFPSVMEIRAVADVDVSRAEALAAEFHIPIACNVETLLKDSEITLAVNLTPPQFHTSINRQILEASKHLFCEKPFALTLEDAQEILDLAKKKNLRVGSAPDTFLGSGLVTCRKLLKDGWIGRPLYVNANMMYSIVETWHPSPEAFYRKGGGPIFDMAGYYITALVSMFGSVTQIYAVAKTGYPERTIYVGERRGKHIPVETPTFYAVILEMENGVTVTMNFSFDVWKSTLPLFEVYGTEGTMMVPDPNNHGGVPKIYRKEQRLAECFGGQDTGNGEPFALPELAQNVGEYVRGLGVMDLAKAIQSGTKSRVSGEFALHVVDVMTGIMKSAEGGALYKTVTRAPEVE